MLEKAKEFVTVLSNRSWLNDKKISVEVKKALSKLGTKYKVGAFPTVIFTDEDGKKLGEFMGAEKPGSVLKQMEKALQKHRKKAAEKGENAAKEQFPQAEE